MNAIVEILATWRLARLVAEDEITRPFRVKVEKWAAGAPEFSLRERVETGINCPACMSVWAGAGVLIATRSRVGRFLVGVLAASGAALTVEAAIQRLER
jgi:uncharacterized protein DUF1360